jgi:hypothetical protein
MSDNKPVIEIDARGCRLYVISKGQAVPVEFTSLVTRDGSAPEVIRLAGGCKGLSKEFVDGMIPYFLDAFAVKDADGKVTREFRGTAFSGGTANADKDGGLKSDMITNVPAALAAAYHCIAMSTTPRTGTMAVDKGGLIVDLYGGRLDYRQHAAVIFQQDPAEVLEWNGDLELYLTLMEGWQMVGLKTGIIAMNGGDVTREEIYGALKRRIPVIAIEGSGRECDAFIAAFRHGDFSLTAGEMRAKLKSKTKSEQPADDIVTACTEAMAEIDRSLVSIVPLGDSAALRDALLSRGFLSI